MIRSGHFADRQRQCCHPFGCLMLLLDLPVVSRSHGPRNFWPELNPVTLGKWTGIQPTWHPYGTAHTDGSTREAARREHGQQKTRRDAKHKLQNLLKKIRIVENTVELFLQIHA
jgi:hypothetical protein